MVQITASQQNSQRTALLSILFTLILKMRTASSHLIMTVSPVDPPKKEGIDLQKMTSLGCHEKQFYHLF